MKLLNAAKYKAQYPNAYLNDYITYLEEKQTEAETVLESAITLGLSDSVLEQIEAQSLEITHILGIIESRLGQIILNSVDNLSLEELQAYFDYSKEEKEQEKQKAQLETEKQELERALTDINDKIETTLIQNGRCKEFYGQTDTSVFFEENITPVQLYSNLLSGGTADVLYQDIKKALEIESKIQSITLSEEELERVATEFVSLIQESKKILEYSPEAKEQVAKNLMKQNGIIRIFPSDFDEQTPIFIAYDFMSFRKKRTSFYELLLPTLQQTLVKERFIGKTYESLKRTYEAYQSQEEIDNNDSSLEEMVNDDLNEEERKERARLKERLAKVNYDITCLDAQIETRNNFLSDAEAMRAVLKAIISKTVDENQVSIEEINTAIEETEKEKKALIETLLHTYQEFISKTKTLQKAKAILTDPDYHSFFTTVERNNRRRIYKWFGVNATEQVVLPFVEAEEKRFHQLKTMVSGQNELDEIYQSIQEKKATANFITRQRKTYKETLKRLHMRYQQTAEQTYKSLQENNLFHVSAPQISMELTVENVMCLPAKSFGPNPESFDEIVGIEQTFWNMTTGIDANTQKKFIENNPGFIDWESYAQFLMQKQQELIAKLFQFSKDENGYYHFSLTKEERAALLDCQRTIISIAESVYEERKKFRQSLGTTDANLDYTQKSELEAILGTGNNLSRENLATYIDYTEQKLIELKKLLFSNKELCIELGMSISFDGPEEQSVASNDLESRIKNFNIEGITTLKDAIFYRDILVGLSEYTVSKEEVKQFYLKQNPTGK